MTAVAAGVNFMFVMHQRLRYGVINSISRLIPAKTRRGQERKTCMSQQPIASPATTTSRPSPGIAYLLWLLCFVGLCGIHRFYSGRWLTGLIWLFTGGLLLIGQLVDLVLIPGQCQRPKW